MSFSIIGTFKGHTIQEREGKSKPGTKFKAGDALFEIDNSYQYQGQTVPKVATVPFNTIYKAAEHAETFRPGQRVEINFEITGREGKGKDGLPVTYPQIRALWFREVISESGERPQPAANKDGDIPF